MTFKNKINQLNNHIMDILKPYINNNFVLFDLPYHTNIGDVLIWEGEVQFLEQFKDYKLLYSCNSITCRYPDLSENTIIFLHGGGNFGDIWRDTHKFKEKVINRYPNNKIIIFPQTVWYNNKNLLLYDAEIFSKHKNLIICARDNRSYKILNNYFSTNTILLVPDMAFCISTDRLKQYQHESKDNKILLLRRTDRELRDNYDSVIIENKDVTVFDWPSIEKNTISSLLLNGLLRICKKMNFLFSVFTNYYASNYFKYNMIKLGAKFIYQYEKIYTTRLHAAILCCLLEKPFILIDNSYGKNRSFFETWLADLDNSEIY
jgi:pyruvyl transferase EpsO